MIRSFATDKGGKKVTVVKAPKSTTELLVKKLGEEIAYEEEQTNPSDDGGAELPTGWERIDIADIIGEDEGFIVAERAYKDERICLLTSTQVLDLDGEEDEDMEEDEEVSQEASEDDDENVEAVALLLIAITKKSQTEPLFIQCLMGRYGLQITKVHIGSGMSGLHDEIFGPASVLYHAYMAYRQEKSEDDGQGGEDVEPGDDAIVSSPDFATLDPELQELWEKFLEERGITEDVSDALMNALEAKEQERYVKFLTTARDWIRPAPKPKA